MKFLFLIFISFNLYAACPSVNRTNYVAGTKFTSDKYNLDMNIVYEAVNGLAFFDGNCIADGTITDSKIEQSASYLTIINSLKAGCNTYIKPSSVTSFYVNPCILGINGNIVSTSAITEIDATTCAGCDALATGEFYIYAKDDSSGSTLNILVLDDAPDGRGFLSNHRVLGKFYYSGAHVIEGTLFPWRETNFDYNVQPPTIIHPTSSGTAFKTEVGTPYFNFVDIGAGITYMTNDNGVRLNVAGDTLTVPAGEYLLETSVYSYNGAGSVDVGLFTDKNCTTNFGNTISLLSVATNTTNQNSKVNDNITFHLKSSDFSGVTDEIAFCLQADGFTGLMSLGPIIFKRIGD